MRFSEKSNIINKVMTVIVTVVGFCTSASAQQKIVNPNISYAVPPLSFFI